MSLGWLPLAPNHVLFSDLYDVLQASKMLLDCVATFTCTELCTYKQFMFYTLLTSLIALGRNDLRKKVRPGT
jgi:26S proteasome regulatory subunit N7